MYISAILQLFTDYPSFLRFVLNGFKAYVTVKKNSKLELLRVLIRHRIVLAAIYFTVPTMEFHVIYGSRPA